MRTKQGENEKKKGSKEPLLLPFSWNKEKTADFQTVFLDWYDLEKRSLPWRENQDPYQIWISEIMLQQTRVDTVIPYYYRFMKSFPSIEDLAKAPESKLLKVWEGLGYYSRVRNLQKAAQQIVSDFMSKMPDTMADIRSLKGIGPYTAGAIGSIAFNLPEPAIDGNVMRVASRLFCIDADIAKSSSRQIFDFYMRQILSTNRPGDFNQALMDLGSAVCTPSSPKCEICPIQSFCQSYEEGTVTHFPVKSKKTKAKPMYYAAFAIENDAGEFLLRQRPEEGLLRKMWTFPLIEISNEKYAELTKMMPPIRHKQKNIGGGQLSLLDVAEEASAYCAAGAGADFDFLWQSAQEKDTDALIKIVWQKKVRGEISHVFSHLHWHVLLVYGHTSTSSSLLPGNHQWAKPSVFSEIVFPKAQQKLVDLLLATK